MVGTIDGPLSGTSDTTQFRYDNARQVVGVVGPDPDGGSALLNRAQRMTYDARGNVTLVEAGTTPGYTNTDWSNFVTLQQRAAVYDGFGRPVQSKQQSAAGTTYGLVQTTYDAAGRTDCVAVRMNPAAFGSLPGSACTAGTAGYFGADRISQITYNSLGQVTATTRGLGTADAATEGATYTDNGLPESLTDGNGNVSILVYDDFDRLDRLRYPNATGGGTSVTDYEEYGYDKNSNVVSYRDRAAQTTTTTYDDLNRADVITPPSGYTQTMAYDNLGRITSLQGISPAAWNMAWTYDVLGRQLTQTGAFGGMTLTSQYDIAGRRTRVTWPDSVYVTYDHDLYGATTDIKLSGSTSLSAYAYDDLGRLTGITRTNGAATTYGYDAVSRLTSLAQNPSGSTNDVTVTLGYNPAGQIFSRAVSNSSYIYAPATQADAYAVNGLNRVTGIAHNGGSPASVTYDSNGNVTAGLGASLGYDDQDNLASAAGTTTWLHDPLGRMYNQVISGTTTRFAYDGMKLATEYAGASGTTIAARHVPGLWMDDIALSYAGSGTSTPSWPLTDERGSVIALTDGSGAVTAINTYDEYGVPASGSTGRFQYTGQIWLPTAGLYDYKMRSYAAGTGRFVQTDPLGYAAGANLYGYVSSDSINLVDPLGLEQCFEDLYGERDVATGQIIRTFTANYRCYSDDVVVAGDLNTENGGGSGGSQNGQCPALARGPSAIRRGAGSISYSDAYAIASRIASEELARTRSFGVDGHNTIYDAERHARWTYRMAVEIGAFWAELFAVGHEYEGGFRGQPINEMIMDGNNNMLGIQAARNGWGIPNRSTPGLMYISGTRLIRQGC